VSALRLRALEVAKRERGKGESGGNNRGEHVDHYRKFGRAGKVGSAEDWCASFVSFAYRVAAAELHLSLPFETSAGAKRLVKNAGLAGRLIPPLGCSPFVMAAGAGGIVCWHRGLGAIDWRGHVGIIERYEPQDDALWTVEGNKGPIVTQYHYPVGAWRKRLYRLALV
jgi:hypothetical protein